MQQITHRCNRIVGDVKCIVCSGWCIKHGTVNRKQRFRCKSCGKTFLNNYKSSACRKTANSNIVSLLKEGCGIGSISRLLKISATTVMKRILSIAKKIQKPFLSMSKSYEVDEMRTYYKNKGRLLWIVYALQKDTKAVADFVVGSRTKATLEKVIRTLSLSEAKKIYTDGLNLYGFIIAKSVHSVKQYGTNHIERKNLSVRTHLKRLNRKTICFSKSVAMLSACLKIYFWG